MVLLKYYREEKNMTQKALATYLGISERQYQRIESGDSFPSKSVSFQLEDLFGVPQRILLAKSAEDIPDYLKQYTELL